MMMKYLAQTMKNTFIVAKKIAQKFVVILNAGKNKTVLENNLVMKSLHFVTFDPYQK